MANPFIVPPKLEAGKYEAWRKEMKFWEQATNVKSAQRASVVFLSLSGKAREAVLELEPEDLNVEAGLTLLYAKLDSLFKTDSDQAAFAAYENFEKFSRSDNMSMSDYKVEFDRLVQQLKHHKMELPEPVLAYRALKSANLSENDERLIRATVKEIKLDSMMLQLTRVLGFGDSSIKTEQEADVVKVKSESNVMYSERCKDQEQDKEDEQDEVYYNRSFNNSRGGRGYRGGPRYGKFGTRRGYYKGRQNARGESGKFNPPGPNGNPSRCNVCGSVMHWARDCPHTVNSKNNKPDFDENAYDTNIVLINIDKKEGNEEKTLLGETVGAMVLDSGCSRSVCGLVWYQCFVETLSESVQNRLFMSPSKSSFRFGTGTEVKSLFSVKLPCKLAGLEIEIHCDVVGCDIPLLLSKKSMKRANMVLDFKNDSLKVFNKILKLNTTESGHYYIPLASPSLETSHVSNVLFVDKLKYKSESEKRKVAEKLHRQFSHPTAEKLHDFVKGAGITDESFLNFLLEIPSKCEVCLKFKKAKPKPVVGLPLATRFNQVMAMDIKEIRQHKILHMIDHASRYSVAARVKTKDAKEVVLKILRYWVAYFGAPGLILTDNGGEFDNELMRDIAQNLNTVVTTTAAYSPWSNGLVERHNAVLGEMVLKTLEDNTCDLDTALSWAVCAKNSLHNSKGFSPNQLVFGYNPNLPSVLHNKLPALENTSCSEMIADNLNALHSARKAFIQAESSEKIQRALRHQVRDLSGLEYSNGDFVYYKRPSSDRWMGPGTVVGSENKQVIVKHGGAHYKVHPCRLQPYRDDYEVSEHIECTDRENVAQRCPTRTGPSHSSSAEPLKSTRADPFPNMEVSIEGDEAPGADLTEEAPVIEQTETAPSSKEDLPKLLQPARNFTSSAKTSTEKIVLPKPGSEIKCRFLNETDEESWRKVKVISKGGKATGKNKHVLNVSIEGSSPIWLDFKKSVKEWEEDSDETNVENNINSMEEEVLLCESDFSEAKQSELLSWKSNDVYDTVRDQKQDRIQTRWVCTTMSTANGVISKARLVAKGFQDPDAGTVRSDSPTCAKESLRLVLAIVAAKSWSINAMDIKTAFLQGMTFDRDVYVSPPPEAEVPSGFVWKLKKCVYGLSDASRVWYLTVRQELLKLGAKVSVHDEAIFTFSHEKQLQGIISTHVDDFFWAGTKFFEMSVISGIRKVFNVKSEEKGSFRYLGLQLSQNSSGIKLTQDKYVECLQAVQAQSKYNDNAQLSSSELSACRSAIGKLNWIATQTRPDLGFDVSELTSHLKNNQIASIKMVNKTIRKARKEKSCLFFPCLGPVEQCNLITYSDASFANHTNTSSQGGYIIFLSNVAGLSVPISWQSRKVKRVVKSTHAAETLALVDATEAAVYFQNFMRELLGLSNDSKSLKIHCKTDSNALYKSVHSNTQILDKRLRIETAILRQMIEKKEVASIDWVPSTEQLADSLTKFGVPSKKILPWLEGLSFQSS